MSGLSSSQRLLLSVPSLLLMVNQVAWPASGASLLCPQHFGHKVRECLEPYWSVAALFNSDGHSENGANDAMAEQLCLQFEVALVCLHAALTECPSHTNIQYVQSKLGSDWAMEIRDLCVGQSGLVTNRVPGDELAEVEGLLDSSSELLETYFADVEEKIVAEDDIVDDENDVFMRNNAQEIILVVPRSERFNDEFVVQVRKRVRLMARPYFKNVDLAVGNVFDMFRKNSEKLHRSTGSTNKIALKDCILLSISLCILASILH